MSDRDVYLRIRLAIERRSNVQEMYDGFEREFSPHILGRKGGEPRVLGYQFAGQSASGLGPDGSPDNWRCFFIGATTDVQVVGGPWHTAFGDSGLQTCIDDVDLEIPPTGQPLGRPPE